MRRALVIAATVAACAGLPVQAVAAPAATEWSSTAAAACATRLDDSLASLDRAAVAGRSTAAAAAGAAQSITCLERTRASAPARTAAILDRALADARRALAGSDIERAVARASAAAGLRVVAAHATIASVRRGEVAPARAWLVLRERRPATRIGVPEAPAAAAITALADRSVTPAQAAEVVSDDLLATSLVVLRSRLDQAAGRAADDLREGARIDAARAAATAQLFDAPGLAPAATRLARAAANPRLDAAVLARRSDALDSRLSTVTAGSMLDDEAAALTAAKLARFIDLVSVEYGRGVRDGRVTTPLEIQEARSFLRGAADAWTALEPVAQRRDADTAGEVGAAIAAMDELVTRAEQTPDDVASAATLDAAAVDARAALGRAVPKQWLASSSAADLELVRAAISNLETAAARGDWHAAEQARVEAYGAFEFGPELRLRAIDPGLALRVEELIWFGDGTNAGLATLVAARAAAAERAATLDALATQLEQVEERLGSAATPGAIRTNSAIIVIREGMEAVLILAALTAGLAGAAGGRWRRPILVGGLLALVATAITFVAARALLGSLARFGEQLEVVVSLVAIGVLLLILNWFVHKAYWTGWMANFQKKKVSITGTARERREAEQAPQADPAARRATAIAQVGGLVVLGFTSIYREGFETVLFLQALVLEGGTWPVLEGTAIGLAAVSALAVLTIGLQRRLPYRRMLIATGVLIAVVLAAMVGGTVQGMQAVGWLGVHPVVGLHVPAWMSTWLGVHPTWEAISAQFAAIVFVIGSYVVAEWWQERRRVRRRIAAGAESAAPTASDAAASSAAAAPATGHVHAPV